MNADTRQALLLTAATWALAIVLYLVPYALFGIQGGMTEQVVASIINVCAAGAAASFLVRKLARAVSSRRALVRLIAMSASVPAAAALVTLYDVLSSPLLELAFTRSGPATPLSIQAAVNFVGVIWPFALLAAVYSIIEANSLARERERELTSARAAASHAEAAASAAQLAALRYQLNPHFLFNTLNAISSLIVTGEHADADAMLAKLSEFLRATLSADPEGLMCLEDELATLQHYLEIERVRFEERLDVEFACPPELNNALVPSFVLQPLVENAVKYGVAPSSTPVTIRVEAAQDGADLVIMIEDNGEAAASARTRSGTGVGLANVRTRLQVLYGDRGTLEAVRREAGFIAILRLPLARKPMLLRAVA